MVKLDKKNKRLAFVLCFFTILTNKFYIWLMVEISYSIACHGVMLLYYELLKIKWFDT